jgi:hypothetical protein
MLSPLDTIRVIQLHLDEVPHGCFARFKGISNGVLYPSATEHYLLKKSHVMFDYLYTCLLTAGINGSEVAIYVDAPDSEGNRAIVRVTINFAT